MRSLKAFTLIELLIVIVIISILIALIIPMTAMVRSRAIRINCLSNLRQIGVAMDMYLSDYGSEQYPQIRNPGEYNPWGLPTLKDILYPHLPDDGLWVCKGVSEPLLVDWEHYTTYWFACYHLYSDAILCQRVRTSVRHPTKKPLAYCHSPTAHSNITESEWLRGKQGGVNIVFIDGHVKYVPCNRWEFDRLINMPR